MSAPTKGLVISRTTSKRKHMSRFGVMVSVALLVLFSITLLPVDHVQASSSGAWWVGAQSVAGSALPNTGVEAKIQVLSQSFSGCLSFWVSESELSNGDWAQMGYYICYGSTPVAFYQVWNIPENEVLAGGTASASIGAHTFSIYVSSGTTWSFAVDGSVVGAYNMGSTQTTSYPVYALSEQNSVSAPQAITQVEFYTAINVLRNGVWQPAVLATSYGTAWGLAGNAQNSHLPLDSMVVGGGTSSLSQRTQLWNGVPAVISSTSTTLTCSPFSLQLGSSSTCTATVADTSSGISTTPTGTVPFTSNGPGTFNHSSCALAGAGASSACTVTYTPTGSGTDIITATYGADLFHYGSSDTFTLVISSAGIGPLGVDGSGTCANGNADSCKVVLTTSSSSSVIVVGEATQTSHTANPPSDTAGLNWISLKDYSDGNIDLHLYYAIAAATLTSDTITCNFNLNARSACVAFGISGANQATVFDQNPAVPCSAKGTSTTPTCNISTTNPDDIVIGFAAAACNTPLTAGPGFTIIRTEASCGPSIAAEYQIVSSTQTNHPIRFALGASSKEWVTIGEAVMTSSS